MDSLTIRQYQILEMIDEDYITADKIAEHLDISVRTVKSEISKINDIVQHAD